LPGSSQVSSKARHAGGKPLPAALGFRAHSGWAAAVVLGGSVKSPSVLSRSRVELIEGGTPKQPYHASEGLQLAQAEAIIMRSIGVATGLAGEALRSLIAHLDEQGYALSGCGVLQASGRSLPGLAQVLASHALIHTAEGQLFRDALAVASEQQGLAVLRVKEKDLYAKAAEHLRLPFDQVTSRVAALGKPLGPPWGQDEKCAALIAWMALPAHA